MIGSVRPVGQSGVSVGSGDRLATWVLGMPGVGKTFYLLKSAWEDLKAGRGLTFIDPHEDAYRRLVKMTAAERRENPDFGRDVVLIDPMDPVWAPGINLLELLGGVDKERLAGFFTDLMVRVWNIDTSIAVRMTWLMMHATLALSELGLSLYELPVFLRDHEWRQKILERGLITSREVRQYFEREFPTNDRLRTEWMQPVLNRMGKLVFDPDLACIFGQLKTTIPSFRTGMDRSMQFFVNLAKGRLGRENSSAFGSVIVGLEQQAFMSRFDIEDEVDRPEHFLYLDEWQNFAGSDLPEFLAESRKPRGRVILANQSLFQLSEDYREAVMNLASTIVCFKIGFRDAEQLANLVWVPEFRERRWRFVNIGRMPVILPSWERIPSGEVWESYALELSTLKEREFWVRSRSNEVPFKQRTLDLDPPACSRTDVDSLVTLSGTQFARRKEDVRRELKYERPRLLAELAGGQPAMETSELEGIIPVWGD